MKLAYFYYISKGQSILRPLNFFQVILFKFKLSYKIFKQILQKLYIYFYLVTILCAKVKRYFIEDVTLSMGIICKKRK
jgi:hypothetical protein